MTIRDRTLHLAKFEEPRSLRGPIGDFFKSLAIAEREQCAGVILSGTGGLPFIKECGGLCVAQEPHTARYDSMPNAAIATGAVDLVAAPEDIAQRLQETFRQSAAREESAAFSEDIVERLGDICIILRASVGHDAGAPRATAHAYSRCCLSRSAALPAARHSFCVSFRPRAPGRHSG